MLVVSRMAEVVMSPWLRRRDGSVVYAERNPDGSWFEMPAPCDPPSFTSPPVPVTPPTEKPSMPASVRQFLREIGKGGGHARAARHSRDEISAWGRVRHKNKPGSDSR
jgi:hypothetical protein